MKLLVTGGAGFIGSTLVLQAIKKGHEVINLDALTYAACLNNLKSVRNYSGYAFEHGDIRNRNFIDNIFLKYLPDSVMHLAAESHVDRSIEAPADFIETNILGTYNMLEAARAYWTEQGNPKNFRFHHISTDEVFGSLPTDLNVKFTEDSYYKPSSPYSASKASADHLVKAWHGTYGLPVLLTHCSNNYGPYQFPEKLIPFTIKNALSQRRLPIYGTGKNIRDWIHVEDHADALLTVLEKGKSGRSYNIGGENEITNVEVVQKICAILDTKKPRERPYEELITFVNDRPNHDQRYAIDPKRIRDELGWQPSKAFDDGLKETVQWYLDNSNSWEPFQRSPSISSHLGIKK